jgi:hypothetical protein
MNFNSNPAMLAPGLGARPAARFYPSMNGRRSWTIVFFRTTAPLSRAGPSLPQHPRLKTDGTESLPSPRPLYQPLPIAGTSEALVKTLWRDSALPPVNLSSDSIWFHLPPAQHGLGGQACRFTFPQDFLSPFLTVPALKRWTFPRSVVNYHQAGKRCGDLLTGDRGHQPES